MTKWWFPGTVGAEGVNGATVGDEQQALVATSLMKRINEGSNAVPEFKEGLTVRGMRVIVDHDVILNSRYRRRQLA